MVSVMDRLSFASSKSSQWELTECGGGDRWKSRLGAVLEHLGAGSEGVREQLRVCLTKLSCGKKQLKAKWKGESTCDKTFRIQE